MGQPNQTGFAFIMYESFETFGIFTLIWNFIVKTVIL